MTHPDIVDILLVEDNVMNKRVTTMLLEAMGYSISVVNGGFDAAFCLR